MCSNVKCSHVGEGEEKRKVKGKGFVHCLHVLTIVATTLRPATETSQHTMIVW